MKNDACQVRYDMKSNIENKTDDLNISLSDMTSNNIPLHFHGIVYDPLKNVTRSLK
jgi:hypothetical protein